MKPHPRIRKTVKWGGAVVTALLVVVWLASGWFGADMIETATEESRLGAAIISGALIVGHKTHSHSSPLFPTSARFYMHNRGFGWKLLPFYAGNGEFVVPLLSLAALSLTATGFAWRLDTLARRRARANLCPKCHYDLTGLAPGALCPECGQASTPS